MTLLAALLFGLVPAIAAFVSAPAPTLRQTGAAPPRSRRTFGNGLVVAQVAISLALMSVSQMSVAHLRQLRDDSLGFERHDVLLISINTSRAQNREQLAAIYRTLVPRLQTIPGVRAVAASATTPSAQGAASRFLRAEGFDEPAQDKSRASLNWVSPNYFATFRTPVLAGREFRDGDMDQPRRVIVNQALARRYFASRNPIGLHVWLENERDPYEIVGVVGDAKYGDDIRLMAPPTVYVFAPMSRGSTTLSVRTDGNPIAVAANARQIASNSARSGCRSARHHARRSGRYRARSRAADGDPVGVFRRHRRTAGSDRTLWAAHLHRGASDEGDRHSHDPRGDTR
jgi:putative ABC transport system permease protein